ncbi:MAG: efflux RND transporter periplasmic adaptor subunit [Hyphomicrobiales bacterium]|nr:efflux RND transporter periplasmic adaptor subunit [Hyphomicrobiales bacterium]
MIRLLAGVLALAAMHLPAFAQQPPTPAVIVTPAKVVELAETMRFNGRLDAGQRVNIVARVGGTLQEIGFAAGDMVEKDQILYRIEHDLYAAAVQEAEGALRAAEASRDLARIERDRQAELVRRDTVAQAVLDNAEAALARAEADVTRLEGSLKRAQLNLSYTEIKAPFPGRISTSAVDVGALIGPESGALATLVGLDPIHAEFKVPTARLRNYLDRVEAGTASQLDAVTIELANGKVYDGKGDIDFVDSIVSAGTDSVTVRARFDNPNGDLRDSELVRVVLTASPSKGVLAIPQQAVQRDILGAFVLVVKSDNTVEQRRIEVDRTTEGMAVISSGIEEGERVITEGVNKVRPGATVDAATADEG